MYVASIPVTNEWQDLITLVNPNLTVSETYQVQNNSSATVMVQEAAGKPSDTATGVAVMPTQVWSLTPETGLRVWIRSEGFGSSAAVVIFQ